MNFLMKNKMLSDGCANCLISVNVGGIDFSGFCAG
jgi:hypothetical protein